MTMAERKEIKAEVGLLELAKQLGSVTQVWRVMGYSRDSFDPADTHHGRSYRLSDQIQTSTRL